MEGSLKPVELFLALGLTVALGACGNPSPDATSSAADATPTEHATTSHSDGGEGGEDGGEGGEGGESGAGSGDADVDYMTTLGLMKGHMIVAEELMALGQYDEAQPHIEHPVEELYAGVEDQLAERNVPEFKTTLNGLNDLAKSAPEDPQTKEAFNESLASIDGAIAAIPEEQLQSPEFVMNVVNGLLAVAAEEYAASISDGQFVELVEYQDSRGFVLYAETLYSGIADQVSQERPDDHAAITGALEELKTAWPEVNPPDAPIKTSEEIYGLVSQVELHS